MIKLDLNMQLLKMSKDSERMDSELSSMIFQRSGMMLNGTVLQLIPLVSLIRGTDCSLLPTIVSSDNMNVLGKNDTYKLTKSGRVRRYTQKGNNASLNLGRFVRFFPEGELTASEMPIPVSSPLCPKFAESLMGFPQGWTSLQESKE